MPGTKSIAVGILCVLCAFSWFSSISCQDSEDTPPLTIDPFRLTIEVGKDATFTCSYSLESNLTRISWFYPDNMTEVEPESNSTRVYVDSESQLHVRNAQENDTGLYLCKATFDNSISTIPVVTVTQHPASTSTDGRVTLVTEPSNSSTHAEGFADHQEVEGDIPEPCNATVALTVYVMPTYFTEGMIILGINLGLLLIFLICLTQSLISERKRMRTYHKK